MIVPLQSDQEQIQCEEEEAMSTKGSLKWSRYQNEN